MKSRLRSGYPNSRSVGFILTPDLLRAHSKTIIDTNGLRRRYCSVVCVHVRFRGESGHDDFIAECQLMTQNRVHKNARLVG
jgi:hypothetical protein